MNLSIIVTICIFSFFVFPMVSSGQPAQTKSPIGARSTSSGYEEIFNELVHLSVKGQNAAPVHNVTLSRDREKFELLEGTFAFCRPVNNRICAALFLGKGKFSFRPPTKVEQQQLRRFFESDSFATNFSSLFLLFADSTEREFAHKLSFGSAAMPSDADETLKRCIRYLSEDDEKYFDPDCFRALQGRSDFFYSQFKDEGSEPFFFEIDPFSTEQVIFSQGYTEITHHLRETINQYPKEGGAASTGGPAHDDSKSVRTEKYTIGVKIEDNLAFSAVATLKFTPLVDSLRWIPFSLFSRLHVDSAVWREGASARLFQRENNPLVWIDAAPPLRAGQEYSITFHYHGGLLERNDFGWVSIKSPDRWFPRPEGRSKAVFDLTYTVPRKFTFVSVGNLVSSQDTEESQTTHWVTKAPIRNASFNLGFFKEFKQTPKDLPAITVYMAEGGHKALGLALGRAGIGSGSEMEKQVGEDIVSSVTFFQSVFGRCPVEALYATEIPYSHGEAYPGLLHLSWTTYQSTGSEGFDEIFRAHEVAHQWWGIGVDFKTYHDQWLSEGFAEYSGLWYMQTVLHDNGKFFDVLDKWKDRILKNRHYLLGKGQEAGPVWLGVRTQGRNTEGDYSLIIYCKGAWILHMLRTMLLDLKTMNENRFKGLMQEFYGRHLGSEASTADFQRVVEKYTGEDMGWFFKQWVYDTAIPRYTFAYKVDRTQEGKYRIHCRVRQEDVNPEFKMYVPILVKFAENKYAQVRVLVTGAVREFDLPSPLEPTEVVFNDLHSVLCEVETEKWE